MKLILTKKKRQVVSVDKNLIPIFQTKFAKISDC